MAKNKDKRKSARKKPMRWLNRWFLDSIDLSGCLETDILGRLVEADWRVTRLSTALGNMTAAALEGLANYPDAIINVDTEQIAWTGSLGSQLTGVVRSMGGTTIGSHTHLLENSD